MHEIIMKIADGNSAFLVPQKANHIFLLSIIPIVSPLDSAALLSPVTYLYARNSPDSCNSCTYCSVGRLEQRLPGSGDTKLVNNSESKSQTPYAVDDQVAGRGH